MGDANQQQHPIVAEAAAGDEAVEGCCKAVSTEQVMEHCQVCGEALADAPVVLCRACRTPHHRECWRYNRGCSVYSCGCRTFVAPSPAVDGGAAGVFTVQQPSSNVTFAVLLMLAIFALLGSIALTVTFKTPLLLAGGIPLYIFLLMSSIFYKNQGYYQLSFDPERGVVDRQLVVRSKPIFETERGWLTADDIVEVHLHKYVDMQFGATEEVYVALTDGTRQLVHSLKAFQKQQSQVTCDDVAERIAGFADTTVRLIESQIAPAAEEIALAARERALVDGTTQAATAALPPAVPDPADDEQ